MNRNAIVVFKGRPATKFTVGNITRAEELKMIPEDFEGDIVILGDLSGHSIQVNGNLWVMGKIFTHKIIVNGSLYCYDRVEANYITVKEDLIIFDTYLDYSHCVPGAWPSITAKHLIVGGNVECSGTLDASDVSVEGDLCASSVLVDNISTGGDFTCTGNCSGNIKARGFFLCKGDFLGEII